MILFDPGHRSQELADRAVISSLDFQFDHDRRFSLSAARNSRRRGDVRFRMDGVARRVVPTEVAAVDLKQQSSSALAL